MEEIKEGLEGWKNEYHLQSYYQREDRGYKGLHLYFKNGNNVYYPWEMQLWREQDVEENITNHRIYKRDFL